MDLPASSSSQRGGPCAGGSSVAATAAEVVAPDTVVVVVAVAVVVPVAVTESGEAEAPSRAAQRCDAASSQRIVFTSNSPWTRLCHCQCLFNAPLRTDEIAPW